MDQREAAEQLQTIRILMERAALYRRALGPTLVGIGTLGMAAGALGFLWPSAHRGVEAFILYWSAVAVLALAWTGFWIRRQAVGAAEPFWTPPTRRVLSAMTPPAVVAVFATANSLVSFQGAAGFLPCLWMILYGLGLHAAGHFTMRGIRLLGWAFIASGLGISTAAPLWFGRPSMPEAHVLMALTFGLGHLTAGGWLLAVEKKRPE